MTHRTIYWRVLACALLLWLGLLRAAPIWAHDGPPRLELGADRINPGAPLEVRGVNIAPEQPVMVALIGGSAEYALGQVLGDPHGDFTLAVVVPREAASGDYTVRAFGTNRVVVAARLVIAGSPVAAEGEGEQRDESEPLLAPMPQPQPAPVLPTVLPSLPAAPTPIVPQANRAMVWVVIGLVAAMAAIGLAVVIRRRALSASKTLR